MKYREMLFESYADSKAQEVIVESAIVRLNELAIVGMADPDADMAMIQEAASIRARESTIAFRTIISKIHTAITEFLKRASNFFGRIIQYIETRLDKAYVKEHADRKKRGFLKLTIKDYHGYNLTRIGDYIGQSERILRNHASIFDKHLSEVEKLAREASRGKIDGAIGDKLATKRQEIEADRILLLEDLDFDVKSGDDTKHIDYEATLNTRFAKFQPSKELYPAGNALKDYGIDGFNSKKSIIEYVRNLEIQVNKLNNFDKAVSEATNETLRIHENLTQAVETGTNRDMRKHDGPLDKDNESDQRYMVQQTVVLTQATALATEGIGGYIKDLNGFTHGMIRIVHRAITEACTVASLCSYKISIEVN